MYKTHFIILASAIGYRMKTYEPRCMNKYRKDTILNHLIKKINKNDNSFTTIVSGIKHGKIKKYVKNSKLDNIREVFNDKYEDDSMRNTMRLGAEGIESDSICFIHSDVYFEHELDMDFSESFFTVNPNLKEKEIGIDFNDGFAGGFSYTSQNKWGKVANLYGQDKDNMLKLLGTDLRSLDVELYNKIIDINKFIKIHKTIGHFLEIDTIKELRNDPN